MSSISDCPICYEAIHDTNCVTTECGHNFHTSCLLKNISFNGYKCPCCRDVMVPPRPNMNQSQFGNLSDIIEDDDSLPELIPHDDISDDNIPNLMNMFDNDVDRNIGRDLVNITSSNTSSPPLLDETYDETFILDGMRWLFQIASDEEPDDDTPFADEFESWVQNMELGRIKHNEEVDCRMDLVLSKLKEIGSLSFEDVVRALLYQKHHYFICSGKAYNYNKKVHSTIDSVINRVGI
jgi:hypothetical protein